MVMQNNYAIRTRDDFWLDGVSGSSYGLAVEIPPVPPLAVQRYTQYQYGGDTFGFAPDTVFEPLTITVQARVIRSSQNFDNTELYAFLQGKTTLKLSRFPGYHYRIRRLLGVTPKANVKGNEIVYNIQFVCDPWKYKDENAEFSLPNDGVITNPGTRYSKPIVRLTKSGSDEATITTNGVQFKIAASQTGLITIDSDRMLVYKTVSNVNTAITQYTTGNLPMLSPGQNIMQVSSNITGVTIVGNWRCY